MTTPNLCPQENQALAYTHLQTKTETIVTKTIAAVQELWWTVSLPLLNSLNGLTNPLDNHEYSSITEESGDRELVETAPPTLSNHAMQSPSVRIIPKAWKDYSEKWFYSYPFGDESC